jgi:hypothetical protein
MFIGNLLLWYLLRNTERNDKNTLGNWHKKGLQKVSLKLATDALPAFQSYLRLDTFRICTRLMLLALSK